MKKENFILLYAEHIYFLIKKANWLVTKINAHNTFEQLKFKKDFLIMNQISCQKATIPSRKTSVN